MYYTIIRLFKKIIVLSIITILPIIVYSYISDNTKYTFNVEKETKYKINAEVLSETQIKVKEKIIYFNDKKNLDRIFIKLDRNFGSKKNYELRNINVNNNKANYKIIDDNNILMIEPNKEIKKNTTFIIDIKYILELEDFKTLRFNFKKWYPVLVFYDKNEWNKKDKETVEIEIKVPKEFTLKFNSNYKLEKRERVNIYNIKGINEDIDILITKKK